MTHRCAAIACEVPVPSGMLMCRGHWRMVPGPLKSAVYRTWKLFRGGGPQGPYHTAVKAAVDAVATAQH